MEYSFISNTFDIGNRVYIEIPFNVWETCNRKGIIPVEVEIQGNIFECKLVPKGKGIYHIPIKKQISVILDCSNDFDVRFKIIDTLTRINSNSPYSIKNPIRKIDSIHFQKQPDSGLCVQTCIAMIANIPVQKVIKIMKSDKWQGSVSKMIETLDYFGFTYKQTMYTKRRAVELPKCCIINVNRNHKSHFVVYFEEKYYDPADEMLQEVKYEDIISYLEINV